MSLAQVELAACAAEFVSWDLPSPVVSGARLVPRVGLQRSFPFLRGELKAVLGCPMPTYPSIAEAREIAARHNLSRCIVFFEAGDGRIGYASYGKTRVLCESTRRIADKMWDDFAELVVREKA